MINLQIDRIWCFLSFRCDRFSRCRVAVRIIILYYCCLFGCFFLLFSLAHPKQANATNRFASNNGANQMKCRECGKHTHSHVHIHKQLCSVAFNSENIYSTAYRFEICKRLNLRYKRACVRVFVHVCVCVCAPNQGGWAHTLDFSSNTVASCAMFNTVTVHF